MEFDIHDENGNPQIATEDDPANVPVNGDFDEEKQVNGRYVRDYEDANLEFATDSNDIKTDDLRGCVVDIPGLTDDVWQNTTLKIRKKPGVIDPETNEEEAGEIRIHAIDGSNNWVEVPLDTDLAPDYYVSTGQYADYDSCWIEGIKDGPITIEVEVVINGGTPITVEKKAMICTEKTKAEWQQEVWDDIQFLFGVDASTFDPNGAFSSGLFSQGPDNNEELQAIYNYYGEFFFRDTDNYLWTGLGKLAGATVYAGLADAELCYWALLYPNEPLTAAQSAGIDSLADAFNLLSELPSYNPLNVPSSLGELQTILMGGADIIFHDLAWQYKAFHTSGLCALKHVLEKEGSITVDVEPWQNIEDGVVLADLISSQIGNRQLADREQNVIVQPTFQELESRGWGGVFSFLAPNPVPGASSFSAALPDGRITDTGDRWNWVRDHMWYDFIGASPSQQNDWVSRSIFNLAQPHAWTF